MKTLTLLMLVGSLVVLTGCARHYVLRMSNGMQVTSSGRPKLKSGYYVFKDASGREHSVWQGRVTEIGPASQMAKEDNQFRPQPAR